MALWSNVDIDSGGQLEIQLRTGLVICAGVAGYPVVKSLPSPAEH